MHRIYSFLLIFIISFFSISATPSDYPPLFDGEQLGKIPVAYKGRFRPLNAYARLWLYNYYHKEQTPKESAQDLLWKMHFLGHGPWDDVPLFWVDKAELKEALELDLKRDRFSYNELSFKLREKANKKISDEKIGQLIQSVKEYEQVSNQSILALPSRLQVGEWVSLKALKTSSSNFTAYSDEDYFAIRNIYLDLERNVINYSLSTPERIKLIADQLAFQLASSYETITGTVYRQAADKSLNYPTERQLSFEWIYYNYPLISIVIGFYLLSALFILKGGNFFKFGVAACLIAFYFHTGVLILRCYLLKRPPVSNMFETVIYVPWVAVLSGFFLQLRFRVSWILAAASLASAALLILLKLSSLSGDLENVQAVLDSQYWLTIHVLMVVGSYGVFVLCGVLGHIYLILDLADLKAHNKEEVGRSILQLMYLGTALLTTGTILGGVWAAESWGRFWDWDPKESWAFISICIYILWIHAYRFNRIDNFGLAVGSIIGLISIGFTWYGVNYILGTGLHSYGFGSGGEIFFYLYALLEGVFLGYVLQHNTSLLKKKFL